MAKCHCGKSASFNIRGETKRLFCTTHKTSDMIDVKSKMCETNLCDKKAFYNNRGETKGRFCDKHKEQHMVNVKNKTCEKD